jgi:putative ABC transport system substrate-binding protein
MNKRRTLIAALGAAALARPLHSFAQAERRPRRIGFLGAGSAQNDAPWVAAFREGLAELHWIEGRDYVLEFRFGNSIPQALPALIAELIATRPEVIFTPGEGAIPSLLKASGSIPIVFAIGIDPVGLGFAASLQRPGGTVTGLTGLARELSAKRLQLLKEAFPRVAHVGILFELDHIASDGQVRDIEEAGKGIGVRATSLGVRRAVDIEPAFKRGAAAGVQAYICTHSVLVINERQAIVDRVLHARLPGIYPTDLFVNAGGLISYAPSLRDNFRRAAAYVDKILKGAKAGDLPIEQPTKFELAVNMKTAKALGIKIPNSILVQATRVIE